ncbi:MAG: hypothetical protein LBV75_06545 [Paludibacter sp.]|nr:hypothetical protein [Paludibacter sp.]
MFRILKNKIFEGIIMLLFVICMVFDCFYDFIDNRIIAIICVSICILGFFNSLVEKFDEKFGTKSKNIINDNVFVAITCSIVIGIIVIHIIFGLKIWIFAP